MAAVTGALPPELAERLAPSAGLRNLLTHQYDSIDLDRLAEAIHHAGTDYRDYLRAVAAFLRGRSSSG